jgi:hypothetical protein
MPVFNGERQRMQTIERLLRCREVAKLIFGSAHAISFLAQNTMMNSRSCR